MIHDRTLTLRRQNDPATVLQTIATDSRALIQIKHLDMRVSAGLAVSRLRSTGAFSSYGEARRPASAKAAAVRRSISEGGSASGAKAAALIYGRLSVRNGAFQRQASRAISRKPSAMA
jgi:hypothetical protein